jgi:hypothetical protein
MNELFDQQLKNTPVPPYQFISGVLTYHTQYVLAILVQ